MKTGLKKFLIIFSLGLSQHGFASYHINNFSILQHDMLQDPSMHVGMMVLDPNSGKTVYQYQAEQYFHPASNVKLFTAIAALMKLGSDYQFSTQLATQPHQIQGSTLKGDVYIKFSGDPSFSSQDLNNLLAQLQARGLKKISGDIVLDDTIFPADLAPLGLVHEDRMWAFGATASSISIDENKIAVHFKTDAATPEIDSVNPDFMQVRSNLVWEDNSNVQLCNFQVETLNAQSLLLKGCIPKRLLPTLNLAMPDMKAYAQYLIQQDLQNAGVQLKGRIIQGTMPNNATEILATHASAELPDLLTWMLQNSDNLYASAITKTLGLKMYGIGGDQAGALAITNILAPYHLPRYLLADGNGGSTYDLVTPTAFAQLLYHANQNTDLANFLLSALPEVEVSGTLAKFPAAELKGKVLAKTGTMSNTSSLSGFIETKRGKTLIFSFLIDDTPLTHQDFKAFESKILLDLYRS